MAYAFDMADMASALSDTAAWSPSPPSQEAMADDVELYIAIGIDFGTTYSGVSWAYSADPDQIHEVCHWPCNESRRRDEVQIPTQIDLETEQWGYEVPKNADPIRWFKLLLLKDEDAKEDVRSSKQLAAARKKMHQKFGPGPDAVVDLIAKFLKGLWGHTVREIQHELGTGTTEMLPFRVGITVPAIWPVYARETMKKAASKAGITASRAIADTTLSLVEEPEAAALVTLFGHQKYPDVKVGETFVVCDCGGGTVDVISYTITSLKPFCLAEAAKGDGKLCGAFLVDSAFEKWMMDKSGLNFKKIEANEFRFFVNEEWEYTMKRSFTGDESQESFAVRPPARVVSRLKRRDSISIPKNLVKQFFSKTYNGTRELISSQNKAIEVRTGKKAQKIILAGGLGTSRYLFNELQLEHQNVLQPQRAWSAVARGAVIAILKGVKNPAKLGSEAAAAYSSMPSVHSRVSRFNYGCSFWQHLHDASPPYDPVKDKPYKSVDRAGDERLHRIHWYLKKNEAVDNRDPIEHSYFCWIESRDRMQTQLKIVTSDDDHPSGRPGQSVRELCTIQCDVNTSWDGLRQVQGTDGRIHRRLDGCRLIMKLEGEPKWGVKAGESTVEQAVNVQYGDA